MEMGGGGGGESGTAEAMHAGRPCVAVAGMCSGACMCVEGR